MKRSLVHFRAEEPRAPARYRPWVSLTSTEEVIRRMAPSGCHGGVSYVFSHDQSQEKFRPVSSQVRFFLQPAQRNTPGHIVPAGPSLPLVSSLLIMTPKQEKRGRVQDGWKPCGVCSHRLAHAGVQTCFVGHVGRDDWENVDISPLRRERNGFWETFPGEPLLAPSFPFAAHLFFPP